MFVLFVFSNRMYYSVSAVFISLTLSLFQEHFIYSPEPSIIVGGQWAKHGETQDHPHIAGKSFHSRPESKQA